MFRTLTPEMNFNTEEYIHIHGNLSNTYSCIVLHFIATSAETMCSIFAELLSELTIEADRTYTIPYPMLRKLITLRRKITAKNKVIVRNQDLAYDHGDHNASRRLDKHLDQLIQMQREYHDMLNELSVTNDEVDRNIATYNANGVYICPTLVLLQLSTIIVERLRYNQQTIVKHIMEEDSPDMIVLMLKLIKLFRHDTIRQYKVYQAYTAYQKMCALTQHNKRQTDGEAQIEPILRQMFGSAYDAVSIYKLRRQFNKEPPSNADDLLTYKGAVCWGYILDQNDRALIRTVSSNNGVITDQAAHEYLSLDT